jgi:hypothetical protein
MTIIEDIIRVHKDESCCWDIGKSKKEYYADLYNAVCGMIEARAYLEHGFIHTIVGVNLWYKTSRGDVGMSYSQIKNYVKYVIETGKTLKKPYLIKNY